MSDILASIPLSAIRVFEAAARLKSFTRAAAELGVTQAAVSWQVKALEKRLDQPLFVRLTREVALTDAGERLSRAATEAMNGLRAALADLAQSGDGVLAITCLPSLANLWLGPRIGGFQLQHPQIAVRLETSGRLADLGRESLDVAFRTGGGDWPGLTAHFLFPTIQTPLCTAQTRDRLGLNDPRDLLDAPRIGDPEEWRVWFAAAGVETGQDPPSVPRLMGDSQVLEVASAASGQGVALGSPILFAADLASGRLVAPFGVYAHYGPGHWLAYREDRARARKIRAFRDWMLALVEADPVIARYPRRG